MISGKIFKSQYPTIKLYKLTTETENHNGYQFKDGLNIDTNPINTNKCSKGGIYFTNEENITNWLIYNDKIMKYKREVKILDDSIIFTEENKYKTDKLILKSRKEIYENDIFYKIIVQKNGLELKNVSDQTDEICKIAVEQNGNALEYVKNQTDEICKIAVKKRGIALYYVKKQTEEICKLAVEQNGNALKWVKDQTDEICIKAVKQNVCALTYVKNQTEILKRELLTLQSEEICKLAMK